MAPLNADVATIDSLYNNFCLFEFPYTQFPPKKKSENVVVDHRKSQSPAGSSYTSTSL